MWPLGGLINGLSVALKVPGQDTPASIDGGFAGEGEYSRAGLKFDTTTSIGSGTVKAGALAKRREPYNTPITYKYTEYANMWIHDDFKPFVDSSLYEARFVNVTGNTSFLFGSTWFGTSYTDSDGWIDCNTRPEWYMELYIPVGPGGFKSWSVNGLVQVREKANHANIVTGEVDITVSGEGAT